MTISLLEQLEIEARMAAALVDRLADSPGRNQALGVDEKIGRDWRPQNSDRTFERLAEGAMVIGSTDGALTIDLLEKTPAAPRFNGTRLTLRPDGRRQARVLF